MSSQPANSQGVPLFPLPPSFPHPVPPTWAGNGPVPMMGQNISVPPPPMQGYPMLNQPVFSSVPDLAFVPPSSVAHYNQPMPSKDHPHPFEGIPPSSMFFTHSLPSQGNPPYTCPLCSRNRPTPMPCDCHSQRFLFGPDHVEQQGAWSQGSQASEDPGLRQPITTAAKNGGTLEATSCSVGPGLEDVQRVSWAGGDPALRQAMAKAAMNGVRLEAPASMVNPGSVVVEAHGVSVPFPPLQDPCIIRLGAARSGSEMISPPIYVGVSQLECKSWSCVQALQTQSGDKSKSPIDVVWSQSVPTASSPDILLQGEPNSDSPPVSSRMSQTSLNHSGPSHQEVLYSSARLGTASVSSVPIRRELTASDKFPDAKGLSSEFREGIKPFFSPSDQGFYSLFESNQPRPLSSSKAQDLSCPDYKEGSPLFMADPSFPSQQPGRKLTKREMAVVSEQSLPRTPCPLTVGKGFDDDQFSFFARNRCRKAPGQASGWLNPSVAEFTPKTEPSPGSVSGGNGADWFSGGNGGASPFSPEQHTDVTYTRTPPPPPAPAPLSFSPVTSTRTPPLPPAPAPLSFSPVTSTRTPPPPPAPAPLSFSPVTSTRTPPPPPAPAPLTFSPVTSLSNSSQPLTLNSASKNRTPFLTSPPVTSCSGPKVDGVKPGSRSEHSSSPEAGWSGSRLDSASQPASQSRGWSTWKLHTDLPTNPFSSAAMSETEVDRSSSSAAMSEREVDRSSSSVAMNQREVDCSSSSVAMNQREVDCSSSSVAMNQREVDCSSSSVAMNQREVDCSSSSVAMNQREVDCSSSSVAMNQREVDCSSSGVAVNQREVDRSSSSVAMNRREVDSSEKVGADKQMESSKKEAQTGVDTCPEGSPEVVECCEETEDEVLRCGETSVPERSDVGLSSSVNLKDRRDKSAQTDGPSPAGKKKASDHSSSHRVIDLQAEVCRLRAQLCLSELQRQCFQLELDAFWQGSHFQPVIPGPVSRTMTAVQGQLQHLQRQISHIQVQRDQCLRVLHSGRELQEVPSFTFTLPTGELVRPLAPTGKSSIPYGPPSPSLSLHHSPHPSPFLESPPSSSPLTHPCVPDSLSSVCRSSCKRTKLDVAEVTGVDGSSQQSAQGSQLRSAGQLGNAASTPVLGSASPTPQPAPRSQSSSSWRDSLSCSGATVATGQLGMAGDCGHPLVPDRAADLCAVKVTVGSSVQDGGGVSSGGDAAVRAGHSLSSALTSAGSSPAPMLGDRDVTSPAPIIGDRDVTSPAPITGDRDVTSPAPIIGDRDVTSPAPITGDRDVTSPTPITGDRDVTSPTPMLGDRDVTSPAPIIGDRDVTVSSPTPITGDRDVTSPTPMLGDRDVTSPAPITGDRDVTVSSPTPITGDRGVTSPAPITGDRGVTSPAPITGDRGVTSPAPITGDRGVTSPAPITGDRGVTSPAPITGDRGVTSPAPITGDRGVTVSVGGGQQCGSVQPVDTAAGSGQVAVPVEGEQCPAPAVSRWPCLPDSCQQKDHSTSPAVSRWPSLPDSCQQKDHSTSPAVSRWPCLPDSCQQKDHSTSPAVSRWPCLPDSCQQKDHSTSPAGDAVGLVSDQNLVTASSHSSCTGWPSSPLSEEFHTPEVGSSRVLSAASCLPLVDRVSASPDHFFLTVSPTLSLLKTASPNVSEAKTAEMVASRSLEAKTEEMVASRSLEANMAEMAGRRSLDGVKEAGKSTEQTLPIVREQNQLPVSDGGVEEDGKHHHQAATQPGRASGLEETGLCTEAEGDGHAQPAPSSPQLSDLPQAVEKKDSVSEKSFDAFVDARDSLSELSAGEKEEDSSRFVSVCEERDVSGLDTLGSLARELASGQLASSSPHSGAFLTGNMGSGGSWEDEGSVSVQDEGSVSVQDEGSVSALSCPDTPQSVQSDDSPQVPSQASRASDSRDSSPGLGEGSVDTGAGPAAVNPADSSPGLGEGSVDTGAGPAAVNPADSSAKQRYGESHGGEAEHGIQAVEVAGLEGKEDSLHAAAVAVSGSKQDVTSPHKAAAENMADADSDATDSDLTDIEFVTENLAGAKEIDMFAVECDTDDDQPSLPGGDRLLADLRPGDADREKGETCEPPREKRTKAEAEDSSHLGRTADASPIQGSPAQSQGSRGSEEKAHAYVEEKGDAYVEEKGHAYVEEKGDAYVEEKGDAYVEEKGDAYVEEKGDAYVEEIVSLASEQKGSSEVPEKGDTDADADAGEGGRGGGGDGGGGVRKRATDPECVLRTVTEKLKELYPQKAMDSLWLQKMSQEQTQLILARLAADPHPHSSAPHPYSHSAAPTAPHPHSSAPHPHPHSSAPHSHPHSSAPHPHTTAPHPYPHSAAPSAPHCHTAAPYSHTTGPHPQTTAPHPHSHVAAPHPYPHSSAPTTPHPHTAAWDSPSPSPPGQSGHGASPSSLGPGAGQQASPSVADQMSSLRHEGEEAGEQRDSGPRADSKSPLQGPQPDSRTPLQGPQPDSKSPLQGPQPDSRTPLQGLQPGSKSLLQGPQPDSKSPLQGPQPDSWTPLQVPQPDSWTPLQGPQPGSKSPLQGPQPDSKSPLQGPQPDNWTPLQVPQPDSWTPLQGPQPDSWTPLQGPQPDSWTPLQGPQPDSWTPLQGPQPDSWTPLRGPGVAEAMEDWVGRREEVVVEQRAAMEQQTQLLQQSTVLQEQVRALSQRSVACPVDPQVAGQLQACLRQYQDLLDRAEELGQLVAQLDRQHKHLMLGPGASSVPPSAAPLVPDPCVTCVQRAPAPFLPLQPPGPWNPSPHAKKFSWQRQNAPSRELPPAPVKKGGDSCLKWKCPPFLPLSPPLAGAGSSRPGQHYSQVGLHSAPGPRLPSPSLAHPLNPPLPDVLCPISVCSSSSPLSVVGPPSPVSDFWSSSPQSWMPSPPFSSTVVTSSSPLFSSTVVTLSSSLFSSSVVTSSSPPLADGVQRPAVTNVTCLTSGVREGGAGCSTGTGRPCPASDSPPLTDVSQPSAPGEGGKSVQGLGDPWLSALSVDSQSGAGSEGGSRSASSERAASAQCPGRVAGFSAATSLSPALTRTGSPATSQGPGSGGGILPPPSSSSSWPPVPTRAGISDLGPASPSTPFSALPSAPPTSSPQAFAPRQPLKPIKLSANRYAALPDTGRRCHLACLTSLAEPSVPESLTASFTAVAEETAESCLQGRGGKGACDGGEGMETESKRRNVQENTGPDPRDAEGSEEEAWQVSTPKRRGSRGGGKKSSERPRPSTPATALPPRPNKGKGRNCPSNSSCRHSGGLPALGTSPWDSRSSSAERGGSGRSKWSVTQDGVAPPGPALSGASPRAGAPLLPSLMTLEVKAPPSLMTLEVKPPPGLRALEGGAVSSLPPPVSSLPPPVSSVPQLDQFSFSKKLARTVEALARPRPCVDTGFIDQLVRRNETVNTGRNDTVHTGRNDTVHTGRNDTVHTGRNDTVHTGRDRNDTVHTGRNDTVHTGRNDTVHTGRNDTVHTGRDRNDTVHTGRDRNDTVHTGRDRNDTVHTGRDRNDTVHTGRNDTVHTGRDRNDTVHTGRDRNDTVHTGRDRNDTVHTGRDRNDTVHTGRDSPSPGHPGKGCVRDTQSDAFDASDLPHVTAPGEDSEKVGQKGTELSQPQPAGAGSVDFAPPSSGGSSSKDLPPKITAYKKLCNTITHEFPHLKQEDIVKVIEEVKGAYGGHFNGQLFSDIMMDIRTAILRRCPDKLRSVVRRTQSRPVFIDMSAVKKTPAVVKKSEVTWQQCSSVSGASFKGVEEECSICLVEFTRQAPYLLDCGHTFHKQCIDRWVKDQGERTCPICRTIVLMCEDFPHLGRQPSAEQLDSKEFPHLGPLFSP